MANIVSFLERIRIILCGSLVSYNLEERNRVRRVFIHAYVAGNLGDDLLIRILCERYPKTRFLLWADSSYRVRFAELKNLRVFSPTDKLASVVNGILKRTKKNDNGMWRLLVKSSYATVHIGGSVFVQHLNDFSMAFELDHQLRKLSRRLYVVGANFGPYSDELYYQKYKILFKTYDGICFRDHYSKNLFSEFDNIRYAPDVVFNYNRKEAKEVKKQVLFSVIYMESRDGKYSISQFAERYYSFMASLAEVFIEKGYLVKFISFCRTEGDEKAIEEIIGRTNYEYRDALSAYFYDMDEKECINQFYESEMIVATRFHSIILGWLANKKVLPIVYNVKTLRTLEDMDIDDYLLIEDLNRDNVGAVADKLINREVVNVEEIKKKARMQFFYLDTLLS